MPVSISGKLIGFDWMAPCLLTHVRAATVVLRTEQKLIPGEVIDLEFSIPGSPRIRLTGAVRLETAGDEWTITLLERSEAYQDLRESLTLTDPDSG